MGAIAGIILHHAALLFVIMTMSSGSYLRRDALAARPGGQTLHGT
jgi:hypothetical protein